MSKTINGLMKEALAIKTQEEADKFFAEYLDVVKEANPKWSLRECKGVVRSNLGYMAGYFNKEAAEHMKKFFKANHPIFGEPDYWDNVSQKEAYNRGVKRGLK